MSRVTRRKHVLKEMMEDDFELPTEKQQIVRVVCSRGNNLHEVETAYVEDERFLVTMPTKFRKNVWVKRGDYIVVESIEEGDKVKAEICKILTPEHIKEFTKSGVWPANFCKKSNDYIGVDNQKTTNGLDESGGSGCDTDNYDDLEPNMNRPVVKTLEETDDEDTTDSDGEHRTSEDEN